MEHIEPLQGPYTLLLNKSTVSENAFLSVAPERLGQHLLEQGSDPNLLVLT